MDATQSGGLTEEARRVLFCFVLFPGENSVSGIRNWLQPEATPAEAKAANLKVDRICCALEARRLLRATCRETWGGVSKDRFALAHGLKKEELLALADEAEKKRWWPDKTRLWKFCNSTWFTTQNREFKDHYEKQQILFARVSGLFRMLLRSVSDDYAATSPKALVVFARQLTVVLDASEDLLDLPGYALMPPELSSLVLENLFLEGRDVRPTLRGEVARLASRAGKIRLSDLTALTALAIWTGETALIEKIAAFDWVAPFALRYLDAAQKLVHQNEVLAFRDVIIDLARDKADKKVRLSRSFGLLALTLCLRSRPSDAEMRSVIALVKSGTTSSAEGHPFYRRFEELCYFALSGLAEGFSYRFFTYYDSNSYILRLYGDAAKDPVNSVAKILGLLLNDMTAKHARRTLDESTGPAIEVEQLLRRSGYVVLARAAMSVLAPFLDGETVTEEMAALTVDGPAWLWKIKTPEDSWREVMNEISGITKRAPKTSVPETPAEGAFGWLLHLQSAGYDAPRDLYGLTDVTPVHVASDGSAKALSPEDADGGVFGPLKTQLDYKIEIAALQDGYEDLGDLPELLLGHPHLFIRGEQSRPSSRHSVILHPVSLVRGRLDLVTKQRDTGGVELSLPEWARALDDSPCLHREGESVLAYYKLTSAQRKLLEVFRRRGVDGKIKIPKAGLDAVAELLPQIGRHAHIRGYLAAQDEDTEGSLPIRAETPIPVARLRYQDEMLHVALGFLPCEGGTFLVPGEGAESVVQNLSDEVVMVRRNFESEIAALAPLVEALKPLVRTFNPAASYDWTLDLVSGLDALEKLRSLGARIEWPEGEKLSLDEAEFKSVSFSGLQQSGGWFEMRGSFELDSGRVLSLVEMINGLVSGGGRYMRLSDRSYLRLTDNMRRKLETLAASSKIGPDALEIMPAAVMPLSRAFEEDGSEGALPEDLRKRAKELAKIFADPVATPPGLKATLRSYQQEGYAWLARHARCGFGACLADDMGLGKTVQAIALLLDRQADGPSLVVAPASVCGNWRREIARFAPSLCAVDGAALFEGAALGPGLVVVVSYGLLVSRADVFRPHAWNGVVLDEAQAIKNEMTKRAQVVKSLKSRFRLVATGTPIENRLTELWSIFDFLNPGLLGGSKSFIGRYTENGAARPLLKRMVSPFILRRLKGDVLKDLPPKTEITLPIALGDEERAAYEACRIQARASLQGNEDNRISILAALTRLRRFCCHPSLVLPSFKTSAKLDALRELLGELKDAGHRALIFSQFTDYLAIVRELLKENKWRFQYLDGATPQRSRDKAVADFQSGEGDFFLISLKAGGMGLNLTAANYVILLDPWWNPAVENQAADRVHRIGQVNPVTVYRLIAEHTVEERVLELHQSKLALANDVLEGTSSSALTPEELLGLFS